MDWRIIFAICALIIGTPAIYLITVIRPRKAADQYITHDLWIGGSIDGNNSSSERRYVAVGDADRVGDCDLLPRGIHRWLDRAL
jgi:hypothetical protein